MLLPFQQLRQLGDVNGDAPGFVAAEQYWPLCPARLRLILDVAQCLPVVVADDEACSVILNRSGDWTFARVSQPGQARASVSS